MLTEPVSMGVYRAFMATRARMHVLLDAQNVQEMPVYAKVTANLDSKYQIVKVNNANIFTFKSMSDNSRWTIRFLISYIK